MMEMYLPISAKAVLYSVGNPNNDWNKKAGSVPFKLWGEKQNPSFSLESPPKWTVKL